MTTKSSLRGLHLIFLTTLFVLVLSSVPGKNKAASSPSRPLGSTMAGPSCPSPTVKLGSQCVLTGNATLDNTLILPSDMTLNCQGHRLRARATPDSANSQPQVGIFLNNVRNVLIERCVIDGFDFGVFAIKSKRPSGFPFRSFLLVDNTINARYAGVSLNSVDDAQIFNNTISYSRAGGRAFFIGRNSDFNWVSKNTFVANLDSSDITRAFRVPGPESRANPVLPPANQPAGATPGGAVIITEIEGPEPILLNAIINGRLFQLASAAPFTVNRDLSDNNTLDGNTIRFSEVPVDGIVLAVPQSTHVIGNTIEHGAASAIRVGLQLGVTRIKPGTCSLMPSRLCLEDAGCVIPGLDMISRGVCTPITTRTINWMARDTRIEGNEITGPMGSGISTSGQRTTIMNNTVVGPLRNPTRGGGIRLIGKFGLESSIVTQNSVSNAEVALGLVQTGQGGQPTSFGSKVSRNDFTGYTIAVLTSRTETLAQADPTDIYTLLSELSVSKRGNFWGTRLCTGLRPSLVQKIDLTPNSKVTDRHPYNSPVANQPPFPSPCTNVVLRR